MVSTGHLLSPFAKIRADCAKVTAPKTSPCSATSHSISYGKSLARRACLANGLRVLWIPITSSRCCSGSNFSALALHHVAVWDYDCLHDLATFMVKHRQVCIAFSFPLPRYRGDNRLCSFGAMFDFYHSRLEQNPSLAI